MALITSSATLDGVNAFTLFGDTFNWSNGYISAIDPFGGNGPDVFRADVTLSGTWATQSFSLDGFDTRFAFTDVNDGGSRFIGSLRLGAGGGTASFGTTFIGAIQGTGSREVILSLGAGAGTVNLSSGNDKVTGGSNGIGFINLGSGNNVLTGGTGTINSIFSGNGRDTFNFATEIGRAHV